MYHDSTGQPIDVGDPVFFRGKIYTIRGFRPGEGRHGIAAIDFEETQHTEEIADEWSVDLSIEPPAA